LALLAVVGAQTLFAEEVLPETITIPAGPFLAGSDSSEREFAYRLDERGYRHSVTREQAWYAGELPLGRQDTASYEITRSPITNRQYARFVRATGHRAPRVDAWTWASYGLIHPYEATRRFVWRNDQPPLGRGDYPVVLVSHADALRYAAWLSSESGDRWRLPTEEEWEKAARGTQGSAFPWGDRFDAGRLNSADSGPFDTLPVGRFPADASPYGLLDAAGQVFEWTATEDGSGRHFVKGGPWDDRGCGVRRPAARHSRPDGLKHILVGFRLVRVEGGE